MEAIRASPLSTSPAVSTFNRHSHNHRSKLHVALSFSRKSTGALQARCCSVASPNGAVMERIEQLTGHFCAAEQEKINVNGATSVPSPRLGRLDDVSKSYKEQFAIHCYEVGMNRTASIETVANLLQEVACNHVQSVGFSTDGFATTPSMRKKRLIWVTTRMHIEVQRYPVWGDLVEIETWCQGEGKAGIRRDWLLNDVTTGEIIGRATSTWVMMNQDTRRLSRITDDIREEYSQYCPVLPRYAFPEENSSSLKKIPNLQDQPQYIRKGLMPRRGDLDMNQHVNNVTYIGWILESMPPEVLDSHQLHRITVDYRRECKHDDVVDSLASFENNHSKEFHKTSSSPVNGTAVNGSSVNGTAVNGSSVNGIAVNGSPVNGVAVSGSPVNGVAVNGSHVNGVAVNGSPVNGVAINGSPATLGAQKTTSAGLEVLHVLRFSNNGTEINRGRTVWKSKAR